MFFPRRDRSYRHAHRLHFLFRLSAEFHTIVSCAQVASANDLLNQLTSIGFIKKNSI
jgi:hypothetical protein